MFNTIIVEMFLRCTYFFFRVICRGKIYGEENIMDGPFILAANHVSYLDWLILYWLVWKRHKRKVIFLAKSTLYESKFFKRIARYAMPICVDINHTNTKLVGDALKVLKRGEIIGIFPEGTRSGTGKLVKANQGVVKMAVMAKVPVIPVGLNGFYEMLPRDKKFPRIHKTSVRIGKPIYLTKAIDKDQAKDIYEEQLRQVMKEIGKLTDQDYNY